MKKKPSKKKRRPARSATHGEATYVCDSRGEEIIIPEDGEARIEGEHG